MELISQLENNPLGFMIVIGIFSLLIGSFLNVVIYRLPIILERQWKHECSEWLGGEDITSGTGKFNLLTPRSQCPACGHQIKAWENIPVISYLFLRGKCRDCNTPISAQYPLIETVTALLSLLVAWQFGFSVQVIAALLFTWTLIALFMIDAKTMYLPDMLTYPLLWGGILVNLNGWFVDLESSVIGAMIGYLSLWSIYQLFRLVTGKEGMGHGDFKLLAALGAWAGWQVLPFIIFASSAFGALFGILWMLVKRDKESTPMPFGPWLAIAGFVALVWRDDIVAYTRQIFMPF